MELCLGACHMALAGRHTPSTTCEIKTDNPILGSSSKCGKKNHLDLYQVLTGADPGKNLREAIIRLLPKALHRGQ